jgi:hypothetical protein
MGLLARALVPSGLTHGRTWYPALFLSAESRRCGTHGTKPRQRPPSQPDLPALGEVVKCSIRHGITCECYLALVEC